MKKVKTSNRIEQLILFDMQLNNMSRQTYPLTKM